MTHLTEFHLDIMKQAIQDAADFLSIEISQINAFLPERVDDLDMVDRISFRAIIDESQQFISGWVGFTIYEVDKHTPEEIVTSCRVCAMMNLLSEKVEQLEQGHLN